MKKQLLLLCAGLAFSAMSFAQINASDFSVGIAGNYTMYKGDFQQKTPGVKVEVNYGAYQHLGFTAGFTKGFAIKKPSSISSSNGFNTKTTASEIQFKFSTISVATHYRVIGEDETNFQGYIPLGISFVMVKYDEQAKESIPAGYTPTNQMEPGKENGLTIHGGFGAQYTIGTPIIFGEAGIAFPANQAQGVYFTNPIPLHFTFNVGVRIPFGSRD